MRTLLLLLVLVPLVGGAFAATQAEVRLQATVGRHAEAISLAPHADADGLTLRWTNGRSNVAAAWVFEPLAVLDAASATREGAPLGLRTLRDMTADATGWRSHPDCGTVTYRGALAGGLHYEVCDDATEAYLGGTRDLRDADAALLVTERLPGHLARAEAFEARIHGATYLFTAAPAADAVTFRQGRFVPLAHAPIEVTLAFAPDARVPALRVTLHDVIAPAPLHR